MKRIIALLLICSTAYVGMLQCVGGFNLSKKLHGAVTGIGNKWLRWIVFLILLPVYGLIWFLDIIIFNSIEFWTGSNPISHNLFDENGEYKKLLEKKEGKLLLTYKKYGEELQFDSLKNGKVVKSLLIKKSEPGVYYGNSLGKWQRIIVEEKDMHGLKEITVREGSHVVSKKLYNAYEYSFLKGEGDNFVAKNLSNSGIFVK